jgi:membrane-bound metal-dependent hydrolase YbcI (DUF457 family)
MGAQVEPSMLWFVVGQFSKLSYWVSAIISLVLAVAQFKRARPIISTALLLGALAMVVCNGFHLIFDSVSSIGFRALQPYGDQSVFVWFFYIHGFNLGLLLFFVANLLNHIASLKKNI